MPCIRRSSSTTGNASSLWSRKNSQASSTLAAAGIVITRVTITSRIGVASGESNSRRVGTTPDSRPSASST